MWSNMLNITDRYHLICTTLRQLGLSRGLSKSQRRVLAILITSAGFSQRSYKHSVGFGGLSRVLGGSNDVLAGLQTSQVKFRGLSRVQGGLMNPRRDNRCLCMFQQDIRSLTTISYVLSRILEVFVGFQMSQQDFTGLSKILEVLGGFKEVLARLQRSQQDLVGCQKSQEALAGTYRCQQDLSGFDLYKLCLQDLVRDLRSIQWDFRGLD